jgi:DNA-binding LytR/AlgR family response regulator
VRVLIVDDEPIARRLLRELFEEFPEVSICGEAADGVEALQQMVALRPDAVFLDLHMPGLDGLSTVRSLRGDAAPAMVFVTAHHEHALTAFDSGVVDYLLKPVRKERLGAAIGKVRRFLAQPARAAPRKFTAHSGRDYIMIEASHVVAFQAQGEEVFLISGQRKLRTSYTLKALTKDLPSPPFTRIHRQTILNTDHISRVSPLSSRRWLLTMSNGSEFIVSKRMGAQIRGHVKG